MRTDTTLFAAYDQARVKEPRFVVAILYNVGSIYVTSHPGISGVPGAVLEGVLSEPTLTSQRLNPDEAISEIGSASFALVDKSSQFTTEIRDRLLNDGDGLRGRRCRFYLGYAGMPFSDFRLIGTQDVTSAVYERGRYQVSCNDIQRSLREDIFNVVQTTLASSIDATQTTIALTSTAGLQGVAHGPSYSDAPNQTVGYVKIKDEIIRYPVSGISGNNLTGCTRGVFGTVAQPYVVDPALPAERREKVSEYVYLELPAIKLAYAILTGQLYGSANVLPSGWHLGIDPTLIRTDMFTGIGSDLWNTSDDTLGFVVRFEGLTKQDGKRFLEKELYLLTGTYSPVDADGRLGLKRMVRLRGDASAVAVLDNSNSISVGELQHAMRKLHNVFEVDWSWNGTEYRRRTAFVDAQSYAVHGAAPTKTLKFKGLHGGRHTDGVIFQMLDMVRDRYAGPPLELDVELLPSMNRIEVGDVLHARYQHVRDFTRDGQFLSRAMEVQNVSVDWRRGRVRLELFGSTADPSVDTPTTPNTALPDAYYTAAGTALSSAPGITIVGNTITAATQPLTGSADLNASVYYHSADLTLAAGVALSITGNVQLRVRGFFQVNGTISGVGGGHPGVADDGRPLATHAPNGIGPGAVLSYETIPGTPGFVGGSRGADGVFVGVLPFGVRVLSSRACASVASRYQAAPRLLLAVDGNALRGLPSDLRGSGGAPGGRGGHETPTIGGTGAAGGAGLAIISRGMALGANGLIDLSGANSAATSQVTAADIDLFPGAGGAGGPGTLYVLVDGANFSLPDLGSGRFRARAGTVPTQGNPLDGRGVVPVSISGKQYPPPVEPVGGFLDPGIISGTDFSGSALQIQHVPAPETPVADQESRPAAPSAIAASAGERINTLRVTPGALLGPNDFIEVYASIDNNRANAVRFAFGKVTEFTHDLPSGGTRYYWTRVRRQVVGPDVFSDWLPVSATGGIVATALDFVGEMPSRTGVFLDTFDHGDYARFYNLRDGSPTITYPINGENGGRVLRVQSYGWIAWKKNIPYDPTQIYMMTVRARMVQAPTNGQRQFWAGVEGVAADGETLVNVNGENSTGSQHYFAAASFDFGGVALGTWRTFRGYLSGHYIPSTAPTPDIRAPMPAYWDGGSTIVRFIRPLIIANYNGGDGIMEVDYSRIDRVVFTDGIAPNAATDPIAQSTTAGTAILVGDVTPPHDLVVQTINFTPDISAEVKITGTCSATVDNIGSAGFGPPQVFLELVNNGSGLVIQGDKKDIEYVSLDGVYGGLPGIFIPFSLTIFTQVTAGTSYTARLRVVHYPSGSKSGGGARVKDRFLRVEVNRR